MLSFHCFYLYCLLQSLSMSVSFNCCRKNQYIVSLFSITLFTYNMTIHMLRANVTVTPNMTYYKIIIIRGGWFFVDFVDAFIHEFIFLRKGVHGNEQIHKITNPRIYVPTKCNDFTVYLMIKIASLVVILTHDLYKNAKCVTKSECFISCVLSIY